MQVETACSLAEACATRWLGTGHGGCGDEALMRSAAFEEENFAHNEVADANRDPGCKPDQALGEGTQAR